MDGTSFREELEGRLRDLEQEIDETHEALTYTYTEEPGMAEAVEHIQKALIEFSRGYIQIVRILRAMNEETAATESDGRDSKG